MCMKQVKESGKNDRLKSNSVELAPGADADYCMFPQIKKSILRNHLMY